MNHQPDCFLPTKLRIHLPSIVFYNSTCPTLPFVLLIHSYTNPSIQTATLSCIRPSIHLIHPISTPVQDQSIHPSFHPATRKNSSIHPTTHLSIHKRIHSFIQSNPPEPIQPKSNHLNPSMHLSIHPFIYPSAQLSNHQNPPTNPPIPLSIHSTIHSLTRNPSICSGGSGC